MNIEITILILSVIIMCIFILNRFFSKTKGLFLALLISFLLFLVGIYLKRYHIYFDYRLLLTPFIQIGLLSICHLFYRLLFKIPFNLNMRGFKYPDKLRTNESGFVEFLSGFLSITLIILVMIIFFSIK